MPRYRDSQHLLAYRYSPEMKPAIAGVYNSLGALERAMERYKALMPTATFIQSSAVSGSPRLRE
ncbi:MAG: hypothetical protein KGJ90_00040 [Patescibacteria group bacterium]|nr:hypothetical protein [Patescibacteria group bacterium]